MVQLDTTSASLDLTTPSSDNFNGQIYVATPALLRAFGITAGQVEHNAEILTIRPGLGSMTNLALVAGGDVKGGAPPVANDQGPCPKSSCIAHPRIQTVPALPSGVSAPNTVITEHAIRELGLRGSITTDGWLIETPKPLTAAQISNARSTAAAADLSIETKNDQPTSAEVINWATAAGMLLALAVLAMTVGLIRSETAGDLRTLAATGASSTTRRAITAATAGALALLGALIGTAAAYLAALAWFRHSRLTGLAGVFTHTPVRNLAVILVGLPVVAAVGGWLFAGREPPMIARRPDE